MVESVFGNFRKVVKQVGREAGGTVARAEAWRPEKGASKNSVVLQ